jgi:hypothetical protein
MYRPRGAALRIKDVIAKMNGYKPEHTKVKYTSQEKNAAKEVLHRLLAQQESNVVSYTKPIIQEEDDV